VTIGDGHKGEGFNGRHLAKRRGIFAPFRRTVGWDSLRTYLLLYWRQAIIKGGGGAEQSLFHTSSLGQAFGLERETRKKLDGLTVKHFASAMCNTILVGGIFGLGNLKGRERGGMNVKP